MNFLGEVFRNCEDQIEIRPIPPNLPHPPQFFSEPEDAEKYGRRLNGTADVYFGACTRTGSSGKKEDVSEMPGVWVDIDKPEAVQKLETFPFKPSIVVETSPGRVHAWWIFKEPIRLDTAEIRKEAEAVLKGLARALDGDPACAELARVMRLPGTRNRKRNALSRVLSQSAHRYNLSDFSDLGLGAPADEARTSGNGHGNEEQRWIATALLGVKEGERHATGTRLAGYVFRCGPPDIARAQLQAFGRLCAPAMDPREVETICNDVIRKIEEERHESPKTEYLEFYDVARLIREGVPPIKWDLEDFLPHQTVVYLTGLWKGGKTWLALVWTILLVTGGSFFGLKSRGGKKVLFVEAEYPHQIPLRMKDLCLGLQINPEKLLENVRFLLPARGRRFRLENPECVASLMREAKEFGADWIILDSLRRLTGAEENSSKEMAAVADTGLLPLRDEAGCGVLILDHPARPLIIGKRAKKMEARGTGDKIAACDHQIHVDNFETPTGKVYAVSVGASRVAPERDEPLFLRLQPTVDGGIRFEQTKAPDDNLGGRPPTAIEKARLVILEQASKTPDLTYTNAIAACVAAGVSTSTAKKAWGELKEKVKGQEGQEPCA